MTALVFSFCAGPAASASFFAPPPAPASALAREEPTAALCLRHARSALADGHAEAALGWFEHVVALEPRTVVGRIGMAVTLMQLGRDEDAGLALEEAHDASEKPADVPYQLARLFALAGHTREALATLADALRADPDMARMAAGDGAFVSLRDHPLFLQLCGDL